MIVIRFVLKLIVFLVYAAFAATVLYFPVFELLTYVGRETRVFELPAIFPVDDALLPCLLLALIYGVVSVILRKIEPPEMREKSVRSDSGD